MTRLFTIQPHAWPAPPSPWSFSTLREIEACPRRWALSSAAYPEIWQSAGYPPSLTVKALAGQVIHEAVELISTSLSQSACTNLRDAAAVEVLRRIGGLTAILRSLIESNLARVRINPRMSHAVEQIAMELFRDIP